MLVLKLVVVPGTFLARWTISSREICWMNVSAPTPTDASALAAAVRQLAIEAHRLLADPSCPSSQVRDLSLRLSGLRRELRVRSNSSVTRWIDKLEEKIEMASLAHSNN